MLKSGIDQDKIIEMFANASAKQSAQLRTAVGEATLKAGYDPAMLKRLSDAMVLKRRGAPFDIAYAFNYLLSPAASWITGIHLHVDGGGSYKSKMPSSD